MEAGRLRGIIAAVITPFDVNGAVNLDILDQHLKWLIAQGVHGVMVTGTAGEFANLSDRERLQIASQTVRTVDGRVPVIFHVSHMNRDRMLALTREGGHMGVDAVMVTPPPIVKPTRREIEHYFREVAAAASVDVVIYNCPGRVGVGVAVDTLVRLSDVGNITALKYSGRDTKKAAEVIRRVGERLAVLSGETDLLLPILALGGTGGILTMVNFAPRIHIDLFEAFERGDLEQARLLSRKLGALSEALGAEGQYHAAVKAVIRDMGLPIGLPRPPLMDVSVDARAAIRARLERLAIPNLL
jgi:4-hydroxy-tetrahydrodipicolinate synthase